MGSVTVEVEIETLRASALEAAERPDEAGRAWLVTAAATQDEARRSEALRNAARLAFIAHDDLAVLFVDRHARGLGLGDVVEPWPSRARERLGLEGAEPAHPSDTLAHVELLLARGLWQQAFDAAGRLLADPTRQLDDERRLQAVLARARAAEAMGRADDALGVLHDHLNDFERIEDRKRIYLRAGELLEGLGRFDQAADAYGGKL
jgi:tetratricopeptide (TPR) repeat protein